MRCSEFDHWFGFVISTEIFMLWGVYDSCFARGSVYELCFARGADYGFCLFYYKWYWTPTETVGKYFQMIFTKNWILNETIDSYSDLKACCAYWVYHKCGFIVFYCLVFIYSYYLMGWSTHIIPCTSCADSGISEPGSGCWLLRGRVIRV